MRYRCIAETRCGLLRAEGGRDCRTPPMRRSGGPPYVWGRRWRTLRQRDDPPRRSPQISSRAGTPPRRTCRSGSRRPAGAHLVQVAVPARAPQGPNDVELQRLTGNELPCLADGVLLRAQLVDQSRRACSSPTDGREKSGVHGGGTVPVSGSCWSTGPVHPRTRPVRWSGSRAWMQPPARST